MLSIAILSYFIFASFSLDVSFEADDCVPESNTQYHT